MDKKTEGIAQIVLAVLVIAAAIYLSAQSEALRPYGYAGIFLISMLSAATIFFPAPGWATVIAMSATLDPYMVGIAAGLGAALGELTGFVAGDGARDILDGRKKDLERFEEIVRKYDFAGIFVLAFIPNPLFDIAGIVAGSLKMHWVKFIVACALGRILRYVLLAYIGAWAIDFVW